MPPRLTALLMTLAGLAACARSDYPRLYHAKPLPPSYTEGSVASLDHLGATIIDRGVNFGVYSEHATRTEVAYAAASKSLVVESKYQWTAGEAAWQTMRLDPQAPGHRQQDLILYEVHPKGFTASPASGAQHPGTFRGLGEKADYFKDLG